MAKKTNCTINGKDYYRIYRKVGMKRDKRGLWVPDRKAFYGSCKSEAEAEYQKYIDRKKSGISGDRRIFGAIAEGYIYNVFVNNKSYAASTKQQYINAFKRHILTSRLAGLYVDEITSLDIQQVYNDMDCAPAGLKNVHNLMRLLYRYLSVEGISRDLTANLVLPDKEPCAEAQKTSVSNDEAVVVRSDDELRKIFDGLKGHRLRFLVIMAVHTGCRISELLALTYNDISGNMLSVNKQLSKELVIEPLGVKTRDAVTDRQKTTTSQRTLPLNSVVLRELEDHRLWHLNEMMKRGYRTEYIFTTSNGTLYGRRNVLRALERVYKRVGVPCKAFHVYRHTFGTNLCKNGVPIQTASKLLGHKDINMTAKYYVNVGMDEKVKAVETIAFQGL